jgi:hypothetical protein
MTAVSTFGVFVCDSEIFVAGELIDGLIEAVVLPVAVEWLNASYPQLDGANDDELLSLRQVGLAAKDHHERMRTLSTVGAVLTPGGTTPLRPAVGVKAGRS